MPAKEEVQGAVGRYILAIGWGQEDTMIAVGKYRVSHPERDENGVCVMIGTQTLEIRESTYIDNGYEPPLEALPWDPPQETTRLGG